MPKTNNTKTPTLQKK